MSDDSKSDFISKDDLLHCIYIHIASYHKKKYFKHFHTCSDFELNE